MKLVHRSGFVCLLIALVLAWAGPVAAQAPKVKSGGPKEGIQVHGHWVIEIRNPDGTLATRHEFNNALDTSGQIALSHWLSRQVPVGLWEITLSAGPVQPCRDEIGNRECRIIESASPLQGGNIFKTLTLVAPGSLLRLTGTATAANSASISMVKTKNHSCPSGLSCPMTFTFKDVGAAANEPAISVEPGQQINVTVDIDFQNPSF